MKIHVLKKFVVILLTLFVFSSCTQTENTAILTGKSEEIKPKEKEEYYEPELVSVKYREDQVDLNNYDFEYLDTSKSSFVRGAWYDFLEEYLVINLSGTYYHYCEVPVGLWEKFVYSDSFGSSYNQLLKGKYSCEGKDLPSY